MTTEKVKNNIYKCFFLSKDTAAFTQIQPSGQIDHLTGSVQRRSGISHADEPWGQM